jgi:hypothetical protein
MNVPETLLAKFGRLERVFLIWGVFAFGLCAVFGIRQPDQFFRSYLIGFIYWLMLPVGCQAILMMHHLTGGWWGYPIRRLLEAGTRTYPVMAVLFLPILLGRAHLYPWMSDAVVNEDHLLLQKRFYLNSGFFTLRAVIYFVIWIGLAWLLNKWSAEQDRTGDPRLAGRMEALSGPGIILWGIAITYGVVDWVMSLEPHWYSTIYGMIYMIIGVLIAMAFVIYVLRMISRDPSYESGVTPQQFNDLGNLLLAFVMLWTYLNFAQFLIIWSGNIRDEIPWYLVRAFGGWGAIAAVLIVFHFAVPFLLLLQRGLKRRLVWLSRVAMLMILLAVVDVYWLIAPAYAQLDANLRSIPIQDVPGPHVHPLDLIALVAVGGIWLAAYFGQLKKRPLLPLHDPRFEGVLEHEHGD